MFKAIRQLTLYKLPTENTKPVNYHHKKKYYSFFKFRKTFNENNIKKFQIYHIFLFWLKGKLSRTQFLALSGILVGITAGLAGVILKSLVHYIRHITTEDIKFEEKVLYFAIFPFLGILLTALIVKYVFKNQSRKGIGAILFEIAQNASFVNPIKKYSQIIQSAITVGLGGSAGLESPIAVTGSAIGSNYAVTYKLSYKERTLLLAAGATAGIASSFNAPIAGIMFALEILLTGIVFTDFIPLVIASICGSLVSKVILNESVLFQFTERNQFDYTNTPYYIILGILCGFYARYFVVMNQKVDLFFERIGLDTIKRAIFAGAMLSIMCVLLPPLYGEGYDFIKHIINDNPSEILQNSIFRYFRYSNLALVLFLIFVLLLKAFATPVTIFGGGNGGNFAPTLFAGGTLGFLFALCCKIAGFEEVPIINLVLVGMAGVMSGVLYAPLTAIFLIAESSFGYDLFIPLMICGVTSFLMAKRWSNISPELKKLAEEGKIFTKAHDDNLINQIKMRDLMEKEDNYILISESFEYLIHYFTNTDKNLVAVIDEHKHFLGVISLDDLRPYLFNEHKAPLSIAKMMHPAANIIHIDDHRVTAFKKFDQSNAWVLPVVNDYNEFLGFISKRSLLSAYRQQLQEFSQE